MDGDKVLLGQDQVFYPKKKYFSPKEPPASHQANNEQRVMKAGRLSHTRTHKHTPAQGPTNDHCCSVGTLAQQGTAVCQHQEHLLRPKSNQNRTITKGIDRVIKSRLRAFRKKNRHPETDHTHDCKTNGHNTVSECQNHRQLEHQRRQSMSHANRCLSAVTGTAGMGSHRGGCIVFKMKFWAASGSCAVPEACADTHIHPHPHTYTHTHTHTPTPTHIHPHPHTYTHTHTHTPTPTHIHPHPHTYTHSHTHTPTPAHIHPHPHTYTHTHTHTPTPTHIHPHPHTYTHTHTHTPTPTHIHPHPHTHTHTHTHTPTPTHIHPHPHTYTHTHTHTPTPTHIHPHPHTHTRCWGNDINHG